MKAASLKEIKTALQTLDPDSVQDLCLRLARYKKESKELLTYLLFEASDEAGYVSGVKDYAADLFKEVPKGNVYFVKKSLRKILRYINRQIKYSGLKETEVELRIWFCREMKANKVPLVEGAVLFKLYHQQLAKAGSAMMKLPEDVRGDYQREMDMLS
jgi:hypothetical protein